MSASNRVKRFCKNDLPTSIFNSVQHVRQKLARPNPRVAENKARFASLNPTLVPDRIVMRPGIEFRVDPLSREAFQWFCWISPMMVDEFDALLRLRQNRRTFLDVGANLGVYALGFTAGRPEATALAIDPSPLAFPILCQNASMNAPGRMTCLQIAAGDQSGELRMRVNGHHLEVIADQAAGENERVKIVPVRPLDEVCEEQNYRPDLIKVDVEGFELPCLRGLQKTLRTHRPPIILEIHPSMIRPLGYTEREIADLVLGLDYRFHLLDGRQVGRSFVEDQINVMWYVCHPAEQLP